MRPARVRTLGHVLHRVAGAKRKKPPRAAERAPEASTIASRPRNAPPLVIDLAAVDATDLPWVGGKAANLGELINAGFPVPPGFVVTTAAYDAVLAANGLAESVARAANTLEGAAVHAALERARIPEKLEEQIVSRFHSLGGSAVAVRSSATAEDLPDAAFAGQQETILGIVDERALIAAVRACWASLWSDRAIAYRRKQGFDQVQVKLAVIVQRLIAADVAGVLFTANPITGTRDEIVIDSSPGLGEAVVAGLVTPDQTVLRQSRLGWRIVARRQGRREIAVRPLPGGGTEEVTGAAATGPTMPDATLKRLARLGADIARQFGRPQDIEWVWTDGALSIVQSRPMTALPPPRQRRFHPTAFAPVEYFQIRPYPLDMTTWLLAVGTALTRMFPVERALPSFHEIWVEEDGVVVRFAGWPEFRFSFDFVLGLGRMALLAVRYDPAAWRRDPILADLQARVRALNDLDRPALSWGQLLAAVDEAVALPFAIMELRRHYFPRTLLALGGLYFLLARLGETAQIGRLLSGVDNKTLAANRELERLAAEVRRDPELATIFADHHAAAIWSHLAAHPDRRLWEEIVAFLADYGHRETGSPVLVSQPTWSAAPEAVIGILKGMARVPPADRGGGPLWETARDQVLTHPVFRFAPLRTAFVGLLHQARRFPEIREDTHFSMTMPMPALSRTILEMGRRLTDGGALERAEDVFHLRLDELRRLDGSWPLPSALAAEARETARRRAARRASLADTPLMELPAASVVPNTTGALVAGMPGSPGIAAGPVRVVRDTSAFGTLQPGEVLVAPYTNPSWTPLFTRAAAVVVDTGSAASHAAIIAREYGIPAVMATGDATHRLRDGQRVRVDGSRGLVHATDGNLRTLAVE